MEPNAFVEKEAELFKALAHPTRLRILRLLAGEPWCVCDLSGHLALDQPNVSQHLAVLRSAGLVRARREGGRMVYRLAGPGVEELLEAAERWLRSALPPRVGYESRPVP